MSFNRWSLRTKIIVMGVALPTVLMLVLFIANASQQKDAAVNAIVEESALRLPFNRVHQTRNGRVLGFRRLHH